MTKDQTYDAALSTLRETHPRLHAVLHRAEDRRVRQVGKFHAGVRFRGLEALLSHLEGLANAFDQEPKLARVAFLIRRSLADCETTIEATLSGYLAVAADSMRDVMEIEDLLLDFSVHPEHVDEWLTAADRDRRRRYQPVVIRKRLHEAGVGRYVATAASADYRGHSIALHVSPRRHPIADKGFSTDELVTDAGFWELFEHARRLLIAVQRLVNAVCGDSSEVAVLAANDPPLVVEAWERTQEWQSIYLALLQASIQQGDTADAEGGD